MTDNDIKTIRDTLLWLARQGRFTNDSLIGTLESHVQEFYFKTLGMFPQMDVGVLESRFSQAPKSFHSGKNYIYLPIERHGGRLLPILAVEYNFEQSSELRLQLALFELTNTLSGAVGFRFETPEGANEEGHGHHNYYHTQMFYYFRPQKSQIISKAWCPDTTPAIPVDAQNPVQLLISMLCSLYNMDYTKKLVGSEVWQELIKDAREMQHYRLMPQRKVAKK